MQIRLVYMYLLNVPSVSSRYFNKIQNVSFREIARIIARNSFSGKCVRTFYCEGQVTILALDLIWLPPYIIMLICAFKYSRIS